MAKAPSIRWVDHTIRRLGSQVVVDSPYKVVQTADIGDSKIYLEEITNIYDLKAFSYEGVVYTVSTVTEADNSITVTPVLEDEIGAGVRISFIESGYARFAKGLKRLTGDVLEFTKLISVSKAWTVNHGGIFEIGGVEHFIIGMDLGYLSTMLRIKEINCLVDIYSNKKIVPATPRFGAETVFTPIESEVPAFLQAFTSMEMDRNIGVIPSTITIALIPNSIEIGLDYRIVTPTFTFKVVGLDPHAYKNMNLLTVTHDVSRR